MRGTSTIMIPFLISAFLLTSCGKKEEKLEEHHIPTASEIMHKYTETMTTAPKKAEKAAGAAKERSEAEEKALKEIDR